MKQVYNIKAIVVQGKTIHGKIRSNKEARFGHAPLCWAVAHTLATDHISMRVEDVDGRLHCETRHTKSFLNHL